MYYKVVMYDGSTDEKQGCIVRYLEANSINALFNILAKYRCAGDDEPAAAHLKMFVTVNRNEFEQAREFYRRALN